MSDAYEPSEMTDHAYDSICHPGYVVGLIAALALTLLACAPVPVDHAAQYRVWAPKYPACDFDKPPIEGWCVWTETK